jgi:chromate transporter
MSPERVFLTVLLASLLGFGGLGSLPVLRAQLATAGLHTDTLVLHALAVGNISPGPNGLYLIVVGYFVAGLRGGLLATAALCLPPLLVLLLARVRARLVHLRRFRAALQSLGLAVVALLATTSGTLVVHAANTWLGAVMAVVGTVLLLRKAPPLVGVAVAVVIGLLV